MRKLTKGRMTPLIKQLSSFLALSILLGAAASPLFAQDKSQKDELTSPPYIARTSNSAMVLFHFKTEDIQPLLPKNVKAKADEKGVVSGGIEMYTTDQAFGTPNYSLVFFFVEVTGINGDDKASGNWALWGKMDNDIALNHFINFYNYPYSVEKNLTIKREGDESSITVGDSSKEGFTLKLKAKTDQPLSAGGVANSFSQLTNGKVVKTEIPWLVDGNQATVVSFDVQSGKSPILSVLKKGKPVFSAMSKNSFSYQRPHPQTK
ncbi:hypothetical protein [Cellvibrio sp. NN19]|uniref:hypothetical protein n=1 Tax=Cellvibrio chitinivorans TaxID=3102792 RepID=UPI002B417D88|nr:hypothetical protein [Cellvibrio sp. NN19]